MKVDERYLSADVLANVKAALQAAFAFDKRDFGQPVAASDVIAVIQNVPGVVYTDLEKLCLIDDEKSYHRTDSYEFDQILTAKTAHLKDNEIKKAELLLLHPDGITLLEIKT